MVPTVVVTGVGAVADPVPPVAVVYQSKVFPAPAVADKGTAVVFWQYETGEVAAGAAGLGFTVMVKLLELEHPVNVAVTFIVATMGDVVVFVVTKDGMGLDVPLADNNPMAVLLFVQEKVAPGVALEKLSGPTVVPAQTEILAGVIGTGVGLIVIGLVTVVVPHSLVTASEIINDPALLYVIVPGFADVDEAGVPPGKVQAYVVTAFI